ncbi:MAG: cytochrome c-type biogenesis protein [Bacillota bacterium]
MKRFIAAACMAFASAAFGQAEEVARPDPAVEARLKALGDELRCLVCQNQTIAESNAPLALDLRNQIRSQIAAGRSDDEIRAYMVQRYGDFVLYRPPLKATTIVLWVGPFALLLAGGAIFLVVIRRRRAAGDPRGVPPASAPQRRAEIQALLDDER